MDCRQRRISSFARLWIRSSGKKLGRRFRMCRGLRRPRRWEGEGRRTGQSLWMGLLPTILRVRSLLRSFVCPFLRLTSLIPPRTVLRGQQPSANTVTNAHGLATWAAVMAQGGTFKGHQIVSPQVWQRAHLVESENASQKDLILNLKFNVCQGGFFKSNSGTTWPQIVIDYTNPLKPRLAKLPKLPTDQEYAWYGWFGMGGSHIQWNGEDEVASGYAPNLMWPGVNGDWRGKAICDATVEAVRGLKGKGKL